MHCVNYKMIEGYPSYRVGDDGSVWTRLRRGRVPASGPVYGRWRKRAVHTSPDGYDRIVLYNGKCRRWATVGELVLECHVGPRPTGHVVRHLNRVKTDNRLENIRWGTPLENEQDKIAHGTANRGEGNTMSRLKEAQVVEIKRLLGTVPQKDIAEKFGVCAAQISHIKHGRQWKHI